MPDSEEEQAQQQQQQLRLFASYSPAEVVLRYVLDPNPSPPTQPERDDFEGAIGFVDEKGIDLLGQVGQQAIEIGLGLRDLHRHLRLS